MVIFDTSVIIDHLRQGNKATFFKKIVDGNPEEVFAVCLVSLQELFAGQSTKLALQERQILDLLENLEILPYPRDVAVLAGKITRDLPTNIEFADAAIAATAIVNGAQLATLNGKDFAGIKELELYKI